MIFDFDDIFSEKFYKGLHGFIKTNNIELMKLAVLDPDLENYYYMCYSKYPIIEIRQDDPYNDYIENLNNNPDNPADAIIFNSNILLFYSDRNDWGIYCNRDFEICISVFQINELFTSFINCENEINFYSIKEILDWFNSIRKKMNRLPINKEIFNKLLNNYTMDR